MANGPIPNAIEIRVARSLDDLMASIALRSMTFLDEQDCPFHEEFDGNDLAGAHVIAWTGCEPVGSLRIRWFAEFCKLERVCVKPRWRDRGLGRLLVEEALRLARNKGYQHAIAHAQEHALGFWANVDFHVRKNRPPIEISDYACVEIEWRAPRLATALSSATPPKVLNRPEGIWDRPGVMERARAPRRRLGAA